ncbi:metallophosphoesterase [Mycetocola manganoxydans]|uniref:Metallophosphoesterase n=1 Tax=Mycetocola manganoxydans TaxID=699879 RepID=A0A3L7A1T3_9MICO|nr:metallophosphoesterase [Mycetocola manganoxydans]RLP73531.1 metallophosphoesterase [Mycetocola manganoxydans]
MGWSGGRRVGALLGTLALAGAATFAWGSLVERRLFTLRRETVPVLPKGAASVTILHLSDLHMAPWQKDKQEWVQSLALLKPDLIVDTGDNLGHADGIPGIERAFADFGGIPGLYVHGSNDYFGPMRKNWLNYLTGPSSSGRGPEAPRKRNLDTDRLETFFTDALGWQNLNNAVGSVTINGTRFDVFGVDDPHIGADRLDLLTGLLDSQQDDETLETADAGLQHVVNIGVVHAPYQRVLNSFVNHGADLILAGHTHGGQVCVPGYGALVTNCDIPRDQVKGLSLWRHALRSAFLHVSAGLGTSIYAPVRFACRPEATLLTLVARDTK